MADSETKKTKRVVKRPAQDLGISVCGEGKVDKKSVVGCVVSYTIRLMMEA